MIHVFPDADALMHAAAAMFVEQANQALQSRAQFSVALAGGNTPKSAYELLANAPYRDRVDWRRVHVYWGDERCVPPDDPRSNYRMARLALLDPVRIPADNIHRIHGELPPTDGARAYEAELSRSLGDPSAPIDLVLLGLGTNGHTASLFPGTPVVHEQARRVAEVYVAESDLWRITLTAPVLTAARTIAFLVSGADKADVLNDVLHGAYEPDRLPAQKMRSVHSTCWLIDRAAAAHLPDVTPGS